MAQHQTLVIGLAAAATISLLYYVFASRKKPSESANVEGKPSWDDYYPPKPQRDVNGPAVSYDATSPVRAPVSRLDDKTPLVKNQHAAKKDDKALHARIEDLDKKGKALFKNKQVGTTT
jgi:hypothetical protein